MKRKPTAERRVRRAVDVIGAPEEPDEGHELRDRLIPSEVWEAMVGHLKSIDLSEHEDYDVMQFVKMASAMLDLFPERREELPLTVETFQELYDWVANFQTFVGDPSADCSDSLLNLYPEMDIENEIGIFWEYATSFLENNESRVPSAVANIAMKMLRLHPGRRSDIDIDISVLKALQEQFSNALSGEEACKIAAKIRILFPAAYKPEQISEEMRTQAIENYEKEVELEQWPSAVQSAWNLLVATANHVEFRPLGRLKFGDWATLARTQPLPERPAVG